MAAVTAAARAADPPAFDPASLRWEQRSPMPFGVFLAAGGNVGDHMVVTGGVTQTGVVTDAVQVYDPDQDTWRIAGRMDTPRAFHMQATLDDQRLLVVGGSPAVVGELARNRLASAVIFDLQTGEARPIAPLPRPVADGTAHALPDGRAVIIGGTRAYVYDDGAQRWTASIPLRQSREAHASTVLPDGRIAIIGGLRRDTIELLDLRAGVSRMLAVRLDEPLDDLAAITLPDGRVWIAGGQRPDGLTVETSSFLDLSGPRSRLTPGPKLDIPGGLADHRIVRVGRWAVLVGGETDLNHRDIERPIARLLDDRTNLLHHLPDTRDARDDAVVLVRGRSVYAIGGMTQGNVLGAQLPIAVRSVERLTLPADPRAPAH